MIYRRPSVLSIDFAGGGAHLAVHRLDFISLHITTHKRGRRVRFRGGRYRLNNSTLKSSLSMGGTFRAPAEFQDSDFVFVFLFLFLEKAIKMLLRCILSVIFHPSRFKL